MEAQLQKACEDCLRNKRVASPLKCLLESKVLLRKFAFTRFSREGHHRPLFFVAVPVRAYSLCGGTHRATKLNSVSGSREESTNVAATFPRTASCCSTSLPTTANRSTRGLPS